MPSAAGFFGAFAPETSNISASQQELYQRSLDRQKQLEQAMRDALENRRLEAQIQQENARAALDKRRVAMEEQQLARGGVAQPRGNPVYDYNSKSWKQEMWNPLSGQITVETVPGYAGDPTGLDEQKAKFKAITGLDWTSDIQITPEMKERLEVFGWKFPSTRENEAQKFAEFQQIFRAMYPDWTDEQVDREAMINASKFFAAQQGVYPSRPRASVALDADGLTVGDARAYKADTSVLDTQIKELYKARDASTARAEKEEKDEEDDPSGRKTGSAVERANEAALNQRIEANEKLKSAMLARYQRHSQQEAAAAQAAEPTQPAIGGGGGMADIPRPIRSPLLQGPGDTGQITQQDLNRYLAQASQGQPLPPEVADLLKQAGMDVHVGEPPEARSPLQLQSPAVTPGPGGYGAGLQPPDLPPAAWEQPAARAAAPASKPPARQQAPFLSVQPRPGIGKKWSVSQWQRQNKDPNIKPWQAARQAASEGYTVVP